MKFIFGTQGNMANIVAATIGVFTIVIVLTVTAQIGSQLEDTIDVETVQVLSIDNETFNTGVYGTWAQLNQYPIISGSVIVRNISTGMIYIQSGNYTMNYTDGKIQKI